jgi:hypothetical protein
VLLRVWVRIHVQMYASVCIDVCICACVFGMAQHIEFIDVCVCVFLCRFECVCAGMAFSWMNGCHGGEKSKLHDD